MTARVLTALALFALLVPAEARADGGWTWPVDAPVVTAYRNGSDPYAGGQHRGIDIPAPAGTPVVAATEGTVTFAGSVGSAGLTVSVRTGDGRFDTSYLHLGSAAVGRGAHVEAGDTIGTVGTSGRGSTAAPHLHFGIRSAGIRHEYHDPLAFLPPPRSPEPRAPRAVPLAAPDPAAPLPALRPLPRVARPLPAAAPLTGPASPSRAAPPRRHAGRTEPAPDWATVLDGPPMRWSEQDGARETAARPVHARDRVGVDRGGVDLGWLAACAGLVAAAFLLARPAGPVRALRASSIATCPTTSPRRSTT